MRTKTAVFSRAAPTLSSGLPPPAASTGMRTRMTMVARSSKTSQPMATRPWGVLTRPRSVRPRSRTTVLATERERPSTSPAASDQPHRRPMASPASVESVVCRIAPGMAMPRTLHRSLSEKWRPTPNIMKMTPISASWAAALVSPTKPGVKGLMTSPATR